MSPEQTREEYAYAVGVQTAIWGAPFVDNVHTLYAGLKTGAVRLSFPISFRTVRSLPFRPSSASAASARAMEGSTRFRMSGRELDPKTFFARSNDARASIEQTGAYRPH
jgi:hypothetical protein